MIIICEECGKKYQLNPARIKGSEARFACKACGYLITATPSGAARKTSKPARSAAPESAAAKKAPRSVASIDGHAENLPPPTKLGMKKLIDGPYLRPTRFRFGLTAKLFIVMLLVSLVPLVMFWTITLSQARDRFGIEVSQHGTRLFVNIIGHINEWFDETERAIQSLAGMDAIVSMDRTLQEALFETARKINPDLEGVFAVDAGGRFYAGKTDPGLDNYPLEFISQKLAGSQAPHWQILKNSKTGKPVLSVAAPIKTAAGHAGCIVHLVQLDNFYKQMVGREAGHIDFAFLVKHKQAAAVYPIRSDDSKQKPLNWSPLIDAYHSGRTGAVSFQKQKSEFVLGYIGRTKFGWGIALQKNGVGTSILMGPFMSFAYLLLVIIIVFVAIIAWFSGRALTKPIIKLTDAANRISIGDLDMEIRAERKDEIGDLSEAIARMQDSIRISIERLRRRL